MKTILLTGATGDLGTVVHERLARDYRCVVVPRGGAIREDAYALVHMVGGFAAGSDPETWARMIEVNASVAAKVFHEAIPHLDDGGRIVAISSIASLQKPPGLAAYVASKAALNAMVEVLAAELKARRITVNALLPSAMDTPANAGGKDLVPRANVAEAIAWLLSEGAANVTGELIQMV